MLTAFGAVLGACLFAALYRLRGGGFVKLPGTQLARACWAIPFGALVWWTFALPLFMLPILVISAFVSLIVSGHGEHHDMGRMPAGYTPSGAGEAVTRWLPQVAPWEPLWKRELVDGLAMAVIGMVRHAVVIVPALFVLPAAWVFIPMGALTGLAYWAGYRLPLATKPVSTGPEVAECLDGAKWFLAVLLTNWIM